ncbi:small heat shock protein, chloroplastic-like [Amaranthus tricolor]|uniref:small heat shock protein, chloroplastic-like n=1 Tax=Amaranthus tricolor TaxID=29722 RepID=UPI0025828581|nr:small heat shock protein, chloroplastic-like [Amaranthus tricolor]
MAQSLSQFSNIIPSSKSSNILCGNPYCYVKTPKFQSKRKSCNGVKAMKADRRDNNSLQNSGLKRREPPYSAPIGLWDRFPAARTVQQMLETMDRVMEEPFIVNNGWPSPVSNNGGGHEYVRGRTPWEIKEAEGEYKMRFDMPGMTKDDVKICVEDKMLVIKAEKVVSKDKTGEENGGLENKEDEDWSPKSYGRYNSRIALPENVEFEKIKAKVKDGVLYIRIPKVTSSNKIFSVNVD